MSQNVQPIGALSSQPLVASPSAPDDADLNDRRQVQEEANRLARYRLIIEGGPVTGFIYKSVDRVTGEVISQFPLETVQQLGAQPDYAEGAVIDTTA